MEEKARKEIKDLEQRIVNTVANAPRSAGNSPQSLIPKDSYARLVRYSKTHGYNMEVIKKKVKDAKRERALRLGLAEQKSSNALEQFIIEEIRTLIDEKKRKKKRKKKKKKKKSTGKKDACYHKVKSRYSVWPSAYASGALVKCRKVGAKNWGNSTKESVELNEAEDNLPGKIRDILKKEGGAAGMKALEEQSKASKAEIKKAITGMDDVGLHEHGDYILHDGKEIHVKKKL